MRAAMCALIVHLSLQPPASHAQTEPDTSWIVSDTAKLSANGAVKLTLQTSFTSDILSESLRLPTATYGLVSYGAPACLRYERNDVGVPRLNSAGQMTFLADAQVPQSQLLPPNAELWWSWSVIRSGTEKLETPRKTIVVNRSRLKWRTLNAPTVVVHTNGLSAAQTADLLKRAEAGLAKAVALLGAKPSAPVQIWIIGSYEAYSGITKQSFDDWSGGYALPQFNSVIGVVKPGDAGSADGLLTHELGHIATIATQTRCSTSSWPVWLIEGIAVMLEPDALTEPSDGLKNYLNARFITSLASLRSGFSSNRWTSHYSYEYSGHVVRHLMNDGGAPKLRRLLDQISAGVSVDTALQSVYGLDTDGLDARWRASVDLDAVPLPAVQSTRAPVPTIPLATAVAP